MILASEVKAGTVLRMDGKLYRTLEVVRHTGSGQTHGFIELKLKDIQFGHFADRRMRHADKLEDVDVQRRTMDYLYSDSDRCWFMDPETFEQVSILRNDIGDADTFVQEGAKVSVQLLEGAAISVEFPKIVEARIAQTGPGIRGGQDNTMKPAVLENGAEIIVPQFIEIGDTVRVDTEKIKYVDRVQGKHG